MKNTRPLLAIILAMGLCPAVSGQAGTLDPNFSADGYATVAFASGEVSGYASVQALNGDIYVAGTLSLPASDVFPARSQIAIARLNEDGSLDPGFDSDGKVLGDYLGSAWPWSAVRAIALQTDGKLIVVGEAASALAGTAQTTHQFGIARYNTDGSPDADFSGNGFAAFSFNPDAECRPWDVAIQNDGKIVVAGWTNVNSDDESELNFAALRLTVNGSLDNTFSTDGKVQVDFGISDSYAHAVAVQGDGKIVVAGTYDLLDVEGKMAVARLNADGTLDNTFSDDGKYLYSAGGQTIENAWAVAIDATGRIIVGGEWEYADGQGFANAALFRLTPSGVLDNEFSNDGEMSFGGPADIGAGIRKLDIQCDGKIMAAGWCHGPNAMLLARVTTSGSLDNTFSGDGMAYLVNPGGATARGLCIRSTDQYSIIAGTAIENGESVFIVARHRAETGIVPPAPVITFNPDSCELSASGSGTFDWWEGLIFLDQYAVGNPVSVSEEGIYHVRVTAPNGCVSPWAFPLELNVPCALSVDCQGVTGGTALPGTPCDDSDEETGNDTWSGTCDCVGEIIDCVGVIGGDSLPGTSCDDGNASTVNDMWSMSCVCVGNDCTGVPGGTALPGSPCDDGDEGTGDDAWTTDCDCVGLTIDCLGEIGGPALPGTPCDDGNAETVNDTWIIGCTCIGIDVGIEEVQGIFSGLSAYPNPAHDVVTVDFFLKESTVMGIGLQDMLGRTVAVLLPRAGRAAGAQHVTLTLPKDLSQGNYLLSLTGDAGRAVVRVVKAY